MSILGVNLGKTLLGKSIPDGGAALLTPNLNVAAIAEERVTRKKREGGFTQATRYLVDAWPTESKEITLVVQSTCCEPERIETIDTLGISQIIPRDVPVISCNHHLSHALGVYCTSPFEEALICVFDAGGNVFDKQPSETWWHQSREQASYYIGSKNNVELLARDFSTPFESGFGEIFRALTYYLGWPSSQHTGNSMTLAGLYLRHPPNLKLFYPTEQGSIKCTVKNNPKDPIGMIEEMLMQNGISGIQPRTSNLFFDEGHLALAAGVQRALEDAAEHRIVQLVKQTGIRHVCLSGGVAYNCPLIGRLMMSPEIKGVYVHPASGDQGQSLGNALFGHWKTEGKLPRMNRFSPYCGKDWKITVADLDILCRRLTLDVSISEPENIAEKAADLLNQGKIIAWYSGRAEFGPRALGARSLLAHPRHARARKRLNAIKQRYSFTPVAPVILEAKSSQLFEKTIDSPYMAAAISLKNGRQNYPLLCHADGSCRVQTVRESDHPLLHKLLERTEAISGWSTLLNTSMNERGKPIVDSPFDFLNFLKETSVDVGVIDGKLLIKASAITYPEAYMEQLRDKVILALSFLGHEGIDVEALKGRIDYVLPNYKMVPRSRFALDIEFIKWVSSGRKVTTIRYNSDAVDFPTSQFLPVFGTEKFDNGDRGIEMGFDYKIVSYTIKEFGDLDDSDGIRDGFSGREELVSTLRQIYGPVRNDEPISIYGIELAEL